MNLPSLLNSQCEVLPLEIFMLHHIYNLEFVLKLVHRHWVLSFNLPVNMVENRALLYFQYILLIIQSESILWSHCLLTAMLVKLKNIIDMGQSDTAMDRAQALHTTKSVLIPGILRYPIGSSETVKNYS